MSEKRKKRFVSLTTKLLIAMSAALAVALGVFFGCREFGNFLVWRYYLTEDAKRERVEEVISDLNAYSKEHQLSVNDTDKFAEWSGGKYIYVVLYKDSNLIYAPEWFKDFNGESEEIEDIIDSSEQITSEGVEEGLTDLDSDTDSVDIEESSSEDEPVSDDESEFASEGEIDEEESESSSESESELVPEATTEKEKFDFSDKGWFSGDRSFEMYLTEEAREKYRAALDAILEGNAALEPIYCIDGTLLATVVDYSEDFMYDLVFAISMICAVMVVGIIMLASLSALTSRVKKLAEGVRLVEGGKIDTPLRISGNDEIADLAEDVNSMRNSVIDNMTKGQQAWETNAGLITAMSHDIRTPLTVLLGYLDLIELQEKDEATLEYIGVCKENALRLKTLSDDMFSYFLVFGKNEIALDIVDCDANSTVGGMIAEYEILLSERGYSVQKSGEIPIKTIKTDTVCLGRVIGNIFSNIAKYADDSQSVDICITEDSDFLRVCFSNGVQTHGDSAESTGIGVKTSVRIMEQMGGSFAVKSSDDKYVVELSIPYKK